MNRVDKYNAALDSHKHYDTLSISTVAGMFAVTYGCYSLHKDLKSILYTEYLFLIGVLALFLLLLLYGMLSRYALISRKVSEELEKGQDLGISEVFSMANAKDSEIEKKFERIYDVKWSFKRLSIRNIVLILACGQMIALITTAISLFAVKNQ
jgi:hypothetical protein